MRRQRRFIIIPMAIAFTGTLLMTGCSSKPTQEEMTQLENVQSEIKSLEQRKSTLEQERANLNQSMRAKEAQLNKCETDKTAVKEKLHQ